MSRWYRQGDRIEAVVKHLLTHQETIMATLADIQAAVAAEKTEEDKIVAFLGTLSAEMKDLADKLTAALAANDPAAAQAVVDQLTANTAVLDQALTAFTPSPTP